MTRPFTTRLIALAAMAVLGTTLVSAQDIYQRGSGINTYNGAPNYPLISGFNSMEEDTTLWGQYGFWDDGNDCRTQGPPCWDFHENGRDYALLADYAGGGGVDMPEGASAVVIEWSVFSDNSWGGSSAFQHQLPDSVMALGQYYDFSDFTEIAIDYNNLVPSGEGALFRIKINEASHGGIDAGMEDWYSESNVMLEAADGWGTVTVPLETVPGCCGSGGFNRPGWSGIEGNNMFDMDKIGGFQLEFVAPGSASSGDSTVAGTVVWDNFRVQGVRYNTLTSFEGMPTNETLQSNGGSYTLSTNSDAILDDGSLQVDYTVVGDQGWGGELDLFWADGSGTYEAMNERTGISVFYKVLTPASAGGTFGLRVYDGSELFIYESNDVMVEGTGQWRRFVAPFSEMTTPSWCNCADDGVLNANNVTQVQFVFYTGEGNTTTGSMLFDRMTGYGFQETDFEAPAAPQGLAVIASEYENIISWSDVPGEDGETYNVYASESPITDVTADGVSLVTTVEEGAGVALDPLYYPVADGSLTKYYAITASDRVGNESAPTALPDAVTNNGYGLATISLDAPAGFVADGDLSEFSHITPIHIEAGTRIGHVANTGFIDPDDAADFSGDAYLAIDSDFIYIGIDVADSVFDPRPETGGSDPWLYDGAEFNIGLYDGRAGKHSAYNTSDAPDYKFNLYTAGLTNDQGQFNADPGSEFYHYGPKSGGWVVEAKIPLDSLARDGFEKFVPRNGMWIPLDVVLFDDDTPGGEGNRETILAYSPNNNDNSWSSPINWFYTWIGDRYAVSIENVSTDVPSAFQLHQNYPNPFNPTTLLRYDLPQNGKVTMQVYNVLGQLVQTLVNTEQTAGTYEVRFDASDMASGMYLVQLRSGRHVQTQKMLLVR